MRGLVTGAARGLGLELVKTGLEKGYEIIAAVRKNSEDVPELVMLKKKYGERLYCVDMDVTSDCQVMEAAGKIKARYGSLDFLINNAGVMYESRFDERDIIQDFDLEMLNKTLEVNTVGPVRVLKYFISLLYDAPNSCILNITSEAGHLEPSDYHYPAYGMSKHAANMYTQKICNYIRQKKRDKNMRIYMIHPGRMDTDMGKENAQIQAEEAARGIFNILEEKESPFMEIPFINYKGEQMDY